MRYALPLGLLSCSLLLTAVGCGGVGSGSANGGGGAEGFPTGSTGSHSGSTGSGTGGKGGNSGASTSSGFVGSSTGSSASCPTAQTCKSAGATCGKISDGCDGILQCGDCSGDEQCGAQKPNECGKASCKPKTCTEEGFGCGMQGDGCGHEIDCGNCKSPDTCGGGGTPNECGHGATCKPKSCTDQGYGCGMQSDGCGHSIDCGNCTAPDTCGGVAPNQCGHAACMTKTCSQLGFDCGTVTDGCSGIQQCPSPCSLPELCGGAGMPNKCGTPSSCTGLCLQQVSCTPNTTTTTFSGTVYAPNGVDPLPNVLVYVPNATVQDFTPVVSCDNCSASVTGNPLTSAVTNYQGYFQIPDMPVGANIPVVVQTGRWREQYTIASVTACTDNTTAAGQPTSITLETQALTPTALLKLPSTQIEGCPASGQCSTNIPRMAFVTGAVDALECVMRKIGVADSEFTDSISAPSGRIHLYLGDDGPTDQGTCATPGNIGCAGASAGGSTQSVTALFAGSPTPVINNYDMVLFPCKGMKETNEPVGEMATLVDYANAGGRIFATHFSDSWIYPNPPFAGVANWNRDIMPYPADQIGTIDQTFPKGLVLAEWLQFIGASTTQGQIQLLALRADLASLVAPTQQWMTIANPAMVMHFTFNTPIGADPSVQCGRVLFDDFHVEDNQNTPTNTEVFPFECGGTPPPAMTPQEKLLEYMIFDLGSCVTPDMPTCTVQTCAQLGIECGQSGDGCDDGVVLNCGVCTGGQTCGGGGTPSKCGTPSCTKLSCGDQNISCGPAGDGCGGQQDCGMCPSGKTCGGGGTPGKCGNGSCTKLTCKGQDISCGPAGDGCGGSLQCGTCSGGETCGGGGKPGQCGTECMKQTCADQGFNCGQAGDGCGNVINCGMCTAPETCGGGGQANVCGGSAPH